MMNFLLLPVFRQHLLLIQMAILIVKDVGSAFWNDQSVFNFIDNLLGN